MPNTSKNKSEWLNSENLNNYFFILIFILYRYEPTTKVNPNCYGPLVLIGYEPKTCYLITEYKTIYCDPAKLVLRVYPGKCALKHYRPFTWTGKECKFQANIGLKVEKTVGKQAYQVELNDLHS